MPGPRYEGQAIGFDYPHGRPDQLRAAWHAWEAVADKLEGKARTLNAASSSALALDWSGRGSLAYASTSAKLGNHFLLGAEAAHEAAVACQRLAHDLEHAQHKADAAMVDIFDAADAEAKARVQLRQANERAADALREQTSLDATVHAAKAGGPAAEVAAKAAVKPQRAAAEARANAASSAATHAQGRAAEAHADLLAARRRGRAAKELADDAARRAASALEMVAAFVSEPPRLGVPAVPVTVRPGDGPGVSPSDVRSLQVAKERQHDGKRWPWMLPEYRNVLEGVGDALTIVGNVPPAAAVAVRVLENQKTRDELLRNGVGPATKILKRIASKPAKKVSRGLVPVGLTLGFFTAGAEGRKPLDAAGKSVFETIGGVAATAAIGALCTSSAVDGPVGGAACVVLVGMAGYGGTKAGDEVYEIISPAPNRKRA